jgi:CHAT domain-containing protein
MQTPPQSPGAATRLKERDVLLIRVRQLQAADKYREAVGPAAQAFALSRTIRGPEHAEVVEVLIQLATALELAGDFKATVEQRRAALALQTKLDGPEHWRTADARLALQLAERMAALSPGDQAEVLAALRREQEAIRQQRAIQYARSEQTDLEVLTVYRQYFGSESVAVSRVLDRVSVSRLRSGKPREARDAAAEALAIQRKILPQFHPDPANSLNNMGVGLDNLLEFAAARRCYEESLTLRRKALPPNHWQIAQSLNNLGNTQLQFREYAAAKQSHEEALAIRRAARPRRVDDLATSLENLGGVYYEQREYAAARQKFEEAVALCRAELPPNHHFVARSLTSLGKFQAARREHAAAERNLEQAVAIRRMAEPRRKADIARALDQLGAVQLQLGEYAGARKSLEEALTLFREAQLSHYPEIAFCLLHLGTIQRELRNYAAARRSLDEALTIYRNVEPADLRVIAQTLNSRGQVQQDLRQYVAAQQSYREALDIQRKALPPDHPDIASSLDNLGLLALVEEGDAGSALKWLSEAVEINQRDLVRLALVQAEAEQLRAAAESRASLDRLLSAAARAETQSTQAVYSRVVQVKGAVTAQQRWVRRARNAADPAVNALLTELQQLNRDLLGAALANTGNRPSIRLPDRPADLCEMSERRAQLERELTARSPAFEKFLAPAQRGATDVQAALPADTALVDAIEYLHVSPPASGEAESSSEKRLLAFVVRPGQSEVVQVPLGPSERLARLVQQWRRALTSGATSEQSDPARELRRLVWEPIARHLGLARIVLVSPDGPLNSLPFAALPGPEPGSFLVEEYAFAIVPVPQLLPELLHEAPRLVGARPTLLLAGSISFGKGAAKVGAARAASLPLLPYFPALTGTESEINDLKERFETAFPGAPHPTVLSKEKATKAAFVAAAPKSRYLHLATHGFFAGETETSALATGQRTGLLRAGGITIRPELVGHDPGLLSGVVFAGVNDPARRPEETVLTALEAAELDLSQADLVILSACETGRGQVAGGEGVLGLQRAFQVAGARSVVASLWRIDDEATRELMIRTYDNLWRQEKPLSRLEALRRAQLWMLRQSPEQLAKLRGGRERGPGAEQAVDEAKLAQAPAAARRTPPFFWAGFVLSGDWR